MGESASVEICFSGSEALSLLETQRFDVVISDFNMPGISGLELLNKISQDHHDMILVLITAYGTDALQEEVHRARISYITKPFEPSRLAEIIRGAETAKTRDITENAPYRLIPFR
jgi:two-component system response regulator FlrC